MYLTQRNWASLSALSAFALMFIWVLPNTIALRHALLGVGAIAGLFLIKGHWSIFNRPNIRLTPLYAILGLFIWVLIHYCFFSLNPSLELSEIKGLWMRTLAGFFMAIGFGIALSQFQSLRKCFYLGIFSVPAINLIAYLYDCYSVGAFIGPEQFVRFFFAKIETAYFGGVAASVSVASIIYFVINNNEAKRYQQIFVYALGLLLVLLSAVLSNTKNGVLIAMLLCILLAVVIFFHSFFYAKGKNTKILGIVIVAFILISAGFVWHAQKQLATRGWNTVFQDTQLAMDIDKNTQWQYAEGSRPLPLNSAGLPPAVNTYSRVAWATVGVRLISQYPLGYGSVNQSFNGLQNYLNIYHEHTGQTHSGWIDFGLGFGLPGLFLIFLAIFSIIVLSLLRPARLNLIAATICVMLLPFCLTSEMSYKQYFESMIFFLGMCGTFVACNGIQNKYASRKNNS